MIEIVNFVLHSMFIFIQLRHIVPIVLLLVEIEGLNTTSARRLSFCHSSASFLSVASKLVLCRLSHRRWLNLLNTLLIPSSILVRSTSAATGSLALLQVLQPALCSPLMAR